MAKNYRLLLDLYHEFDVFLHDSQGLYLDSVAGYHLITEKIKEEQNYFQQLFEKDKELSSFSYSSITKKEFACSKIHFTKNGKVKKRNSFNGSNQLLLGNMIIVNVYTFWEKSFRARLENALELKTVNDLKAPIWGDLRILRHGIIHQKNKLKDKDIKKIELIRNWFEKTRNIKIDESNFRIIFLELLKFRNWIHSESLPKHKFNFPQHKNK